MLPRVSVLIPIYAPGADLRSCFASVARQNYQDLEILPIDDAGPEPVQSLIDEFARNDPRWRPIAHERNIGLSASLNDGLRNSTGKYVLVLQQDCEILSEDALQQAVSLLEQNGRWCLSGDPVLPVSEMTPTQVAFAAIWNHVPDRRAADLLPVSFTELKCDLFPKEALASVGAFDEKFRTSGEDQMISLRLKMFGWAIVRSATLRFVLRPGRLASVGSHLRKEFLYGKTQTVILLQTAFKNLETGGSESIGRGRLANRLHGFLGSVSLVAGALTAFAFGPWPWLLLWLVLLPRIVVVGLRAARVSRLGTRRARTVLATIFLGPLDDIVYATGLAIAVPIFVVRRRI